jgi:4-aminobutyrate aminotransferase
MTPRPCAPLSPAEGDLNLSSEREAWRQTHLSEETRRLLDEDERYFLHQSLSTPCLNALSSAQGASMTDVEGREILDFHGNSAHQLGYGHPRVLEAVIRQARELPFCPRRYANAPAVELAKALCEAAPMRPAKLLFAPGGTTAVGMALKLARVATGRFKTLSMWESFHGASLDAISIGGEAQFRAGIGPLLPGAEHVPPPEPGRCALRADGECASCDLACARYVEYVLDKERDVAALIAEPIRCTTGVLPPEGYWPRVRAACDKHGVLLVFDETAVCLGRTGRLFACEHFGVAPDLLILGKGLGGGIMPLAAMLARAELDLGRSMALGHYTHEKNPVAAAAGLATLRALQEEDLLGRCERLGGLALARLREIAGRSALVAGPGAARGLGLLLSLELSDPGAAERVLYRCLRRGLSFKVSHERFLTLTPALTIREEQLDRACDILEASLADEARGATA